MRAGTFQRAKAAQAELGVGLTLSTLQALPVGHVYWRIDPSGGCSRRSRLSKPHSPARTTRADL